LPTVVDAPKSEALLIGSVADSLTGQIMHGARVLLIQLDSQHPDTVAAITEADGQFTLRGIRPGRYQYRVLAVGFQQRRGMVELAPGLDTLQVKLKQGLALCDVRATN
jgi:carboxypeptidase family protein